MKPNRLAQDAEYLQEAVTGVYDAHGVKPEGRIDIAGHPYTDLPRSRIVSDIHASHDGDWAAGSCDAELFELDWRILVVESKREAEKRERERSLMDRLRGVFHRERT